MVCVDATLVTWEPSVSVARETMVTCTTTCAGKLKEKPSAAAVESAAATSAFASRVSLEKSTDYFASVMTFPVQGTKVSCVQVTESATVGSANAMRATLVTTATAQQKPTAVCQSMDRCAVTGATVYAEDATVWSQELLGRRARSAPLVLTLVAPKGIALSAAYSARVGWLTTIPAKNYARMRL